MRFLQLTSGLKSVKALKGQEINHPISDRSQSARKHSIQFELYNMQKKNNNPPVDLQENFKN